MDLLKGLGINVEDSFQKDLEDVMGSVEASEAEAGESSDELADASSDQETDEVTGVDGEESEPADSEDEDGLIRSRGRRNRSRR